MKHIPELDGLRGSAVCMVMAHHYIFYKYLSILGPRWGWAGVDLFFVLSGFLITGILIRCCEKSQGLGNFYMRRVFRLFPIYYLCLALYYGANFLMHFPLPWPFMASFALYLQAIFPHSWLGIAGVNTVGWTNPGFAVLWSLSIEEFFYLLWAPIVFLAGARYRVLVPLLSAILVVEPAIRFFAYTAHAQELRQMFFARADSLAAGALIAVLMHAHGPRIVACCRRRYAFLLALASLLLAAFLAGDVLFGLHYPNPDGIAGQVPERTYSAIVYTLLWIAFSILLTLAVSNAGSDRRFLRLLRNPALRYMGKVSYCAYLIHYPLRRIFVDHFGRAIGLPLGILATLILASLSWYCFEGPIARWKERRFAYRSEAPSPA